MYTLSVSEGAPAASGGEHIVQHRIVNNSYHDLLVHSEAYGNTRHRILMNKIGGAVNSFSKSRKSRSKQIINFL